MVKKRPRDTRPRAISRATTKLLVTGNLLSLFFYTRRVAAAFPSLFSSPRSCCILSLQSRCCCLEQIEWTDRADRGAAASTLVRRSLSVLCAYYGCSRHQEDAEGGGIAFLDGAAYRDACAGFDARILLAAAVLLHRRIAWELEPVPSLNTMGGCEELLRRGVEEVRQPLGDGFVLEVASVPIWFWSTLI
ncbi:hypothetical protein HU200_055764 [Digitaria exilis]|uniref:Uncharacterized protein n=1 Tax=Digitaria exilis TaxID=1010633 RepID=A0A835ADX6_9POAL|nr:hypothetical protein HU200_055764 [Digitaria exilis]